MWDTLVSKLSSPNLAQLVLKENQETHSDEKSHKYNNKCNSNLFMKYLNIAGR